MLSQDLTVLTLLFIRKKYSACAPYKKDVRVLITIFYLGMKRPGGDRKTVCGFGVTLDSQKPSPAVCLVTGSFTMYWDICEADGCAPSSPMMLTTGRLGNPSTDLPFCITGVRGWWSL